MKKVLTLLITIPIIAFAGYYQSFVSKKLPSHDRVWVADQAILPSADIAGNMVKLHNVRDSVYRSVDDFDVAYIEKTVDLNNLVSIDYLVEPFSNYRGPAHTLLSFGFQDGDNMEYVAISVEIRREVGEAFSAWRGIMNEYELMYVVATEEDVIKLRTNYRKNTVYLYPIQTTRENMRAMFVAMLDRVNQIYGQPEFYNTLSNNCTINIAAAVNMVVQDRIKNISVTYVLPAYSDKLAYREGLIDSELSYEELQEKYRIDTLAQEYGDGENFSQAIRKNR